MSSCFDSSKLLNNQRVFVNQLINISYCLFIRTTIFTGGSTNPENGKGSIIYIYNSSPDMSVYYSSFINCYANGHGGAIMYWSSGKGILSSVCGLNCSSLTSGYYGHFSWFLSSNSNFNLMSISFCSRNEETKGSCSFAINNGIITFKNSNLTSNKGDSQGALYISNPSSFLCLFSQFQNNIAKKNSIFWFRYGLINEFCQCNFIKNYLNNSIFLFTDSTTYKIVISTFIENFGVLFSIGSGSNLILEGCEIFHNFLIGASQGFISNSQLNPIKLTFFSTFLCETLNEDISKSYNSQIYFFRILFIHFFYY